MSEPCRHERQFAGTQQDTLTSFIKTSGELVRVQAERDAARTALAEALAMFRQKTHPGLPCRQSEHVPETTIARWREALNQEAS